MTCKMFFAFGGALLMGIAGVATAETQSEAQLKAELSAVQTRLAQLEAKQSNTWLSQRRTEEIKSLISDVLADADTRASRQLVDDSPTWDQGAYRAPPRERSGAWGPRE